MLGKVLKYFEELSKIPRSSGNEEKARNWLISWADKRGFEYKTDKIGNIVIYVEATKGMDTKDIVILQGHIDMVCNKGVNSNHDFKKDPINILQKDGFLTANNTTLGTDNGIGIAIAMSMVDLEFHPKLELLFTVSEEVGLTGAINLDSKMLTGKKLINLDSEELGKIFIASAGGLRQIITSEFEEEKGELKKYLLKISGIKGGHSGIEIDKSRGNSGVALMELLNYIGGEVEFYFIDCGIADNVIPNQLEAVIGIENISDLHKTKLFKDNYRKKYNETSFEINIEEIDYNGNTIGKINSKKILNAILESKNGIYKYSDEIDSFVETSQNLGILKLKEAILHIEYLIRSSNDFDVVKIAKINEKNFSGFAVIDPGLPYPGWVENSDSKLLKEVKKAYEGVVLNKIKILGIHAGLECGTIKSKMSPETEVISIGPNIFGAHTIHEKCEIESIEVIYRVLEEYLRD